ncbi:phage integrase [Porticoccus sp. GXU_MW_L64]
MKVNLTKMLLKQLGANGKTYRVWDTQQPGFHVRVSPKGLITYSLRYISPDDKDVTYTLGRYGQITLDKARELARSKMGLVASGVDVQEEKKRLKRQALLERSSTLKGFITSHYETYLLTERKTGEQLLASLKANFGRYFDKQLLDLDVGLIAKWRTARLKSGISHASVNRDISTLKAALNRAVEWGIIEANPISDLKPIKLDKAGRIRFLNDQEESRLRQALRERDNTKRKEREQANKWRKQRNYSLLSEISSTDYSDHLTPMVLLAINTGMRRGELFHLSWGDVDLERKIVTVEGGNAKTGQTRHIPLNKEANAVLTKWSKQGDASSLVFPSPITKGPMDNIKKSWHGLIRGAEIDNFRFHDCRHHFASQLVMKGVDLNTVRELLGHTSIEMTLRYAHLAEEHKTAAVALLDS